PQVGILPAPNYQLPLALGSGHVDARFLQVTQVLRAVLRIDDVEGPVALREALLDEGEKHPVLLLFAVEEGADMPGAVEDRTRQPYLLWAAHRTSPSCQRHGPRRPSITRIKCQTDCDPSGCRPLWACVRVFARTLGT